MSGDAVGAELQVYSSSLLNNQLKFQIIPHFYLNSASNDTKLVSIHKNISI